MVERNQVLLQRRHVQSSLLQEEDQEAQAAYDKHKYKLSKVFNSERNIYTVSWW